MRLPRRSGQHRHSIGSSGRPSTLDSQRSPARLPHPAILLVVLGDQDVDADARPPRCADEFAPRSAASSMPEREVAVDLLLPQTWSRSALFAQLVMRTN